MKKVGIMTFHRAENYGAFLQAYALSSYIDNSFDADAYLVDYINPKIEKSYKACSVLKSSKNPVKAIGKFALSYGDIRKRNNLFSQDRKSYLKIRREDIAKQDLTAEMQQYDVLIAGSDQVWNLKITGDDYSYLLEDASITLSDEIIEKVEAAREWYMTSGVELPTTMEEVDAWIAANGQGN